MTIEQVNYNAFITRNFSFSNSVFYPFRELSVTFVKYKIAVCKLFQFGRVQNLSFGKELSMSWTLEMEGFNGVT